MSERSQQLRRDSAGKELEEILKDNKPMTTIKLVPYAELPTQVLCERLRLREQGYAAICHGCVYTDGGKDSAGLNCADSGDCDAGVFREVP